MALPANVLKDKFSIIKEREGERLARYVRILFGNEKFGFKWVMSGTSYTDGIDIYALYPYQKPKDGEMFDAPEQRVFRKAGAIHERGHIEYDIIEDYTSWQREWVSNDRDQWLNNEKYPIQWLTFFGNVMIDGRMENLVVADYPTTKEYIDLWNYNWRCCIIEELQGKNSIQDFRTCFFRRAMGMTDYDGWLEESVELVNSIQPLIEEAREAKSTSRCLDLTNEMINKVWPTLIEWMDLENQEPDDFDYSDDHADSEWGDSEEVEQNIKRVMRVLVKAAEASSSQENEEDNENEAGKGASSADSEEGEEEDSSSPENGDTEENKPSQPDFSNALRLEEKNQEKDEKEAEEQLGPYAERSQEVTIWEHREDRKAFSTTISVKPFGNHDLEQYKKTVREVKKHITPTAKALSALLDPVLDEKRRNQRSGKLKTNRVWRTETLSDANVFDRRKKGTPGKDARVLMLNDISGSTSSGFPGTSHRIIDEMKKAQTLMIESCEEAGLPVASYGFTENYDHGSIIYPFKPYGRFTNIEKGFVGGINPMDGNRDTVALQWAVDELAKYTEDIRLLIMLSDGEPCFAPGEDYDTMRSIVQQAEKRGIDILCLYVGPQYQVSIDRVRYMYPGRAIVVSKFLARELSRSVKRIIRKRR